MPPKAKTFSTDWRSNTASTGAIEKFEEMFGKDMGLGTLSRDDTISPYEVIPTGMLALDYAVGIGGLPHGRVCEMWGPEHAGKTTSAMLMIAQAQRKYPNKMTAWVDMEQTFDKKYASDLGVDLKRLWLVENPKTAEDVADAVKRFVESGLCSLVVLDSIGGMISKKEMQKEAEEDTVGLVAKVVTRMVKMVSPMGNSNGTTIMVINQVRANIGSYGADTTTAGGWALKHITSLKLSVRRGGDTPRYIREHGVNIPVSYQVMINVQKNKCYPYGRVAEVWMSNRTTEEYGPIGVDPVDETIQFGLRTGVLGGAGTAWVHFPDGSKANGSAKAKEYLMGNPGLLPDIRQKVLDTLAGDVREESEIDSEASVADPAGMEEWLAQSNGSKPAPVAKKAVAKKAAAKKTAKKTAAKKSSS